jgi:hypothetical protein
VVGWGIFVCHVIDVEYDGLQTTTSEPPPSSFASPTASLRCCSRGCYDWKSRGRRFSCERKPNWSRVRVRVTKLESWPPLLLLTGHSSHPTLYIAQATSSISAGRNSRNAVSTAWSPPFLVPGRLCLCHKGFSSCSFFGVLSVYLCAQGQRRIISLPQATLCALFISSYC